MTFPVKPTMSIKNLLTIVTSPFPKGYELDGKDLTDYGVVVLKGSTAEILKTPAVKKNLLQNFKRQDGAIYDGEVVKFQTKRSISQMPDAGRDD